MFSSVTPPACSRKEAANASCTARCVDSMGTVWQRGKARLAASSIASSNDAADEWRDGIITPRTPFGPTAAAAMQAVTAESMPPESPMITLSLEVLRQ